MTAYRINYNSQVGFAVNLGNKHWRCRFAGQIVKTIPESELTFFHRQQGNTHAYMDKRVLDTRTINKLFDTEF